MRKILFSLVFLFLFINIFAQNKEARKIDEFGVVPCEEFRARLDSFLSELQIAGQSKGFIIVYEGNYSYRIYDQYPNTKFKTYLPSFGESNYRTQVMINHFKFRNFDPSKYLFISGGFREKHEIEFWIVPNGVKPPKASPTLDKIKYRKGKPIKINCDDG